MARLTGIFPIFTRAPVTGGTTTVEGLSVTVRNEMPQATIRSETVSAAVSSERITATVPGVITQGTLAEIVDAIGDVLDHFELDEVSGTVVSRAGALNMMTVDFGVGGNTLVYGETQVSSAPGGTGIRNPASAGAGSFGAVLNGTSPSGALSVAGLPEFTLVFWYRAMSGGLNKNRSIAGQAGQYGAGSDGTNKLAFVLVTETGSTQLQSTGTWFTNDHIGVDRMFVCWYDGAEMRIYVDGVLDGSVAKTGTPVATALPSSLLNDLVAFASQNYAFGTLDDVILFEKALGLDDILALAAGQRTINFGTVTVRVDA